MLNILRFSITIFSFLYSHACIAFDYPKYAKSYLDSAVGQQVGDGMCVTLIRSLLNPIEDSLLVTKSNMGIPINVSEAQCGDIILFGNHIMIVYSNDDGEIIYADQNRIKRLNGQEVSEKFVKLNSLTDVQINHSSFHIYRPIPLNELQLYRKGLSKEKLLKLYQLDLQDAYDFNKMSDKIQNVANKNYTYYSEIIDTNVSVTALDLAFLKYYNRLVVGNHQLKWINTPKGRLQVEKVPGQILKWQPVGWLPLE